MFNSQEAVTIVGSVVLVSTIKLVFPPATHESTPFGIKTVLDTFIGKLERDGSY